jgi:hypothetical protein
MEYLHGRGKVTMSEACHRMSKLYTSMAADQDFIGWRRFMEGMVCKKICGFQEVCSLIEGTHTSAPHWTTGLIHKLFESIHGQ